MNVECCMSKWLAATLGILFIILVRRLISYRRFHRIKKEADERNLKVCIVGAGFGGVGTGLTLTNMGISYVIVERSSEVGGTWNDNRYPGIACDVPSHLYCFSGFLNPFWSESYSQGNEILEYVKRLAEPIRKYIRFETAVESAQWKEEQSKWEITLSTGEILLVDLLITCTGLLVEPNTPSIPGAGTFEGTSFHANRWRSDVEMLGKRVGIIGTGATAVQAVPRVAKYGVKSLTVFQRTPAWVPPRDNIIYSSVFKTLLKHVPLLNVLVRWFYFCRNEVLFPLIFMLPSDNWKLIGKLHRFIQNAIHSYVKGEIKRIVLDGETAEKLTPKFPMGCKRTTPSDSYLQAFNRDNVHLVTDSVKEITKTGILTADGTSHDLDILVYATGFDLIKSVNAFRVEGIDGQIMSEYHGDSPKAYYGITHHILPNYFMLGGPGIVLGHNSVIFIGECQLTYIESAIEQFLQKRAKSVVLKEKSMDQYQEWSRMKMKNKVFEGARFCSGWYRNARGVNWTFWPTNLISFWWYTMTFDAESYNFKY